MRLKTKAIAALAACAMMAGTPFAAGAETNIKVMGWFGNQPQIDEVEIPFWKALPEKSGGDMKATFRTINEVGLKGFEAMRTLQSGAFDIVAMQLSYVGGDDPVLVGVDIPGLAYDFETVRKMVDAYAPVIDQRLQDRKVGKLMALWPFPPQILFCKEPIKTLSDLKGRKVRVTGAVISEMVKSWGATAVTLSGTEVYQALQRGLVECAATGSAYGNQYGWYEVSNQLYVLPVGGYALVAHVARYDFWNKLSAEQKTFLSGQMSEMNEAMWAMGQSTHDDGVSCNTGKEPCKSGKVGKMSILYPSDEDKAFFKKTVEEVAMPAWIKDCERVYPECKAKYNATIGEVVDLKM